MQSQTPWRRPKGNPDIRMTNLRTKADGFLLNVRDFAGSHEVFVHAVVGLYVKVKKMQIGTKNSAIFP